MCKEMMGQRANMEEQIHKDLERCMENIRKNGGCDVPIVLVDMERLYIANREYFERQGFFFDSETRIENGKPRYFAWMKLGGAYGELGNECWKKIRMAREEFIKNQRQGIWDRMDKLNRHRVLVDMAELCFENKLFFEERGFFFTPDTRVEEGQVHYYAWMQR